MIFTALSVLLLVHGLFFIRGGNVGQTIWFIVTLNIRPMDHQTQSILWGKDYELNSNHFSIIFEFCVIVYSFENIYLLICGIKCLVIVNQMITISIVLTCCLISFESRDQKLCNAKQKLMHFLCAITTQYRNHEKPFQEKYQAKTITCREVLLKYKTRC